MEIYIGIVAGLMVWGFGATLFALWDMRDELRDKQKPVSQSSFVVVEAEAITRRAALDAEWRRIQNVTRMEDWA